MLVLDSDIFIAFLKRKPDAKKYIEETKQKTATTVMNAHEILFGATSKKHHNEASTLLSEFDILPYGWNEMKATIKIQQSLLKKGKPIGTADELIAGVCLAHNATIVTRNKKYFSRIKGLKIKTW